MIPVAGGRYTQELAIRRAQVTGAGGHPKGKVWKGADSWEGSEWSGAVGWWERSAHVGAEMENKRAQRVVRKNSVWC